MADPAQLFNQTGFRDFSTTDSVSLNGKVAYGIIAEEEFQTDASGCSWAPGYDGDDDFHARTHAAGTYLMRLDAIKFLSGSGIVLSNSMTAYGYAYGVPFDDTFAGGSTPPPGTFYFYRPDTTSRYFRPDGTSFYLRH